ncbi:hypothetical protein D9O29_06555 [Pantoea vagans]|uniref:Uncharacterized protein n=1 Tax=Pantoea vagans TaxID=470934 RepID=A0ABY3LJ69_9GAMM|nr:hypothetical protein D9O29_06555 [Pantoea vagans]
MYSQFFLNAPSATFQLSLQTIEAQDNEGHMIIKRATIHSVTKNLVADYGLKVIFHLRHHICTCCRCLVILMMSFDVYGHNL